MGQHREDIVINGTDHTKAMVRSVKAGLKDISHEAQIAMKALGAAAVTGLAVATKEAADFEKKMAEVSTLLDDTSHMDAMTASVQKLSEKYGAAPADQAHALYQIISAGATDAAQAVQLLDAADKLSIGGVTDVTTAADGLTSVLNAYGDQVKGAADVSDALFVAMKAGKTTIGELSQNLGVVAPLAANTGVSFDELTAAISALTKGGIDTQTAVIGVRQILASVLKPSSEAAQEAKNLGLEFDVQALKAKGLSGFLKDVTDKTGGSAESLGKLFGNVRAVVPALALAGNSSKDFADILEAMKNKAGQTDKAVAKMQATSSQGWSRIKSEVSVLGDELGSQLLPMVNNVGNAFADMVSGKGGLSPLEDWLFSARKGVVALAEGFQKLWLFNEQHNIFASKEGLAQAKANLQAIQDMGTSIEEERLALIAKREADDKEAEGLMEISINAHKVSVATDEATNSTKNMGDTLQEIDTKTLPQHNKSMDAVIAQMKQWDQQGQQVWNDTRTPLEQYNAQLEHLGLLLQKGAIDQDTYSRAVAQAKETLDQANVTTTKSTSLMQELGMTFTSEFEKAITDGNGFRDVLQGIEQDILKLLARKAITEPLMNLVNGLFGGGNSGSSSGGGFDFSSIISSVMSFFGGGSSGGAPLADSSYFAGDPTMGFATGGSFMVPGSGGTDSQLIKFKATPGERVTVEPLDSNRSLVHVEVNIIDKNQNHVQVQQRRIGARDVLEIHLEQGLRKLSRQGRLDPILQSSQTMVQR